MNEIQKQQLIASINWNELLPKLIELATMVRNGTLLDDWKYTLQLVSEILESISNSAQKNGIDQKDVWTILLPIIIELLPLLLDRIGRR